MPVTPTSLPPPSHKRWTSDAGKVIVEECQSDTQKQKFLFFTCFLSCAFHCLACLVLVFLSIYTLFVTSLVVVNIIDGDHV